jgi:hypothetical protein
LIIVKIPMTGSKHRLIFILLFLASLQIKASYRSEIYFAYIQNRMDLWKSVIERMDAIQNKSDELLLELVNYQYGYIGYCLGFDKKEEAKKYLSIALKNIDCARTALKIDPEYYFAYIQNGNMKFYMPSALGGSKKEALEYYLKDYASAQNVYENILKLESGFLYVKDDLYPKLLRKMEN